MSTLINIDNGGTQTDICVIRGDEVFHGKALTTPYDLSECFVDVLQAGAGEVFGNGSAEDTDAAEAFERLLRETLHLRYSTTEGTNRVVQREGPRLGLILSQGADPESLKGESLARDMFEALVGDRVRHLDATVDDDTLDENTVKAINDLLTHGAQRLVIALSEGDPRTDESRMFDIILRRYPRHLLGAVPVLFSYNMAHDADHARRTWAALLNSFLHPGMEQFLYQADRTLRQHHVRKPMLIYCNDGTSKRVAKTVALKTLDSGPRGGIDGARALARHYGIERCITLDVGGTTADISLIGPDQVPEQRRGRVHGIPISLPLPEVQAIGVAGSSILRVDEAGTIRVGPRSVGSTPGPACFARGGTEATMTDVNLLLGLLDAESYFGGKLKLDSERARQAIETNVAEPLGCSVEEAVPRMVDAFELAIAEGIKETFGGGKATLLAFGGAGPMNACGVARRLGVEHVLVPRLAAVFSAFGIGFSDIAHIYDRPLDEVSQAALKDATESLLEEAERGMFAEGYDLGECQHNFKLEYDQSGQEFAVELDGAGSLPDLPAEAGNVTVQLEVHKPIPGSHLEQLDPRRKQHEPEAAGQRNLLMEDGTRHDVPVYRVEDMMPGAAASGPAVVEERFFTSQVPADWSFVVDENRNLNIFVSQG